MEMVQDGEGLRDEIAHIVCDQHHAGRIEVEPKSGRGDCLDQGQTLLAGRYEVAAVTGRIGLNAKRGPARGTRCSEALEGSARYLERALGR